MAELKTKPTLEIAEKFIARVDPPAKSKDGQILDALFRKVTGEVPRMWGATIVGYGEYHYTYASGHGGDMCRVGFSPRKARHSLYLSCGTDSEEAAFASMLARLGKHSRGKGCIYINKLADIDLAVLEAMIALGWRNSIERYPASSRADQPSDV